VAIAALLVGTALYYRAYLTAALTSRVILWFHHHAGPALLAVAILISAIATVVPIAVLWLRRWSNRPLYSWLKRLPALSALPDAVACGLQPAQGIEIG